MPNLENKLLAFVSFQQISKHSSIVLKGGYTVYQFRIIENVTNLRLTINKKTWYTGTKRRAIKDVTKRYQIILNETAGISIKLTLLY